MASARQCARSRPRGRETQVTGLCKSAKRLFAHFSQAQFVIAREVFGQILGIVFLCAFISIAIQIVALFGTRGIMPVARFLPMAREQLGAAAYWHVPTLCWFNNDDLWLIIQAACGILCSVAILLRIAPGAAAGLCWVLYLSICAVGSPFLDFQWDALLLETAFLAVFFLPWSLRNSGRRMNCASPVASMARLLLWWLLFRLIFESGVVKLASGDPTWRAGTALAFHFETQPLPLWTAWYAHQLPSWLLRAFTWSMFAIELVTPWLILGPRRFRHAAAWAIIALQLMILSTGNYAFFNLLTIALCVLLFEDAAWPGRLRAGRIAPENSERTEQNRWSARTVLFAVVAMSIGALTFSALIGTFGVARPLQRLHAALAPLRSFNAYGLFAVMTTSRPEIVIEGSDDGRVWREYHFRWKPGDLRKRPRLVAPHQPRLDWQMWFAALGDVRSNPWFVNLLARLLDGSPEVAALLDENPFANKPPQFVRALLYDYRFTRRDSNAGAAWWTRKPLGMYCPPLSLKRPGLPVTE